MSHLNTTVYRKEIAVRIVALRQSKRLSKAAFARILGVSRPTLYDLEAGSRRLFADEVLVLSRALDVSVESLLGDLPGLVPDSPEGGR